MSGNLFFFLQEKAKVLGSRGVCHQQHGGVSVLVPCSVSERATIKSTCCSPQPPIRGTKTDLGPSSLPSTQNEMTGTFAECPSSPLPHKNFMRHLEFCQKPLLRLRSPFKSSHMAEVFCDLTSRGYRRCRGLLFISCLVSCQCCD